MRRSAGGAHQQRIKIMKLDAEIFVINNSLFHLCEVLRDVRNEFRLQQYGVHNNISEQNCAELINQLHVLSGEIEQMLLITAKMP
jgi:hypothetical protein